MELTKAPKAAGAKGGSKRALKSAESMERGVTGSADAPIPDWLVETMVYDRVRTLKASLVVSRPTASPSPNGPFVRVGPCSEAERTRLRIWPQILYIAFFIFPVDDNDNTACSIFNNEDPRGLTPLNRQARAAIFTAMLVGHYYHVQAYAVVRYPVAFGVTFFCCLWVCWDRQLVDYVGPYREYLDKYVVIPGVAGLHDVVSVLAFFSAAALPVLTQRRHDIDVVRDAHKTAVLVTLVVAYLVIYVLNPKPPAEETSLEAEMRRRTYWWINIFEGAIMALAVGWA